MGVPESYASTPVFRSLAEKSHERRHQLVGSAEEADACLFVDCHNLEDPISLYRIWRTGTFRHFRSKCFVYDQRPRAYCSLPGIYASVPASVMRPKYQLAWGYEYMDDPRAYLDPGDAALEPDLLFSFIGTARSHPCRKALLELDHPRAIVKRVDGHINWEPDRPGFHDRRVDFTRTTLRSKFVLCPRGRATSSLRFYEAMALGRVPVVIADDWEAPYGIDLDAFALRWPESSTDGLIDFLEEHESEAGAMGQVAKQVYDENFAEEVTFDRAGDLLQVLLRRDVWKTFPRWGYPPDRRVVRHLAGRSRKLLMKLRR